MGYYSDVNVVTNLEGYERLLDLCDALYDNARDPKGSGRLLGRGLDESSMPSVERFEAENVVHLEWDWVKWYDSFPEVRAVEAAVAELHGGDFPVEYLIIGEEQGDVTWDFDFDERLEAHVSPQTVCDFYWS